MSFFSIFADKQLDDIDRQIESLIKSVPVRDPSEDTPDTDASELMHQFLSIDDKFANKEEIKKNVFYKDFQDKKGIMTDVGVLLDKLTTQPDRAARYRMYEELYQSVPLIKKMMRTWIANLIQKNPVTGKSLLIKELDQESEEPTDTQDPDFENKKAAAKSFVDEIMEYFNILEKFKYQILPNQQMYGDCLVEVINLNDFNLSDKKQEADENLSGNEMFLGESSLSHEFSGFRAIGGLTDEQKIKSLQQLVEQPNFNVNDALNQVADFFVDTSDPNERVLNEAFSRKEVNKNQFIILNERTTPKSADTQECFYEYVRDSAGEFKPYLKFKTLNEEEQIPLKRKRGRPKKNLITEQKETFEQKLRKLGINQKIDVSSVLILIHKPKDIVILESSYGTKLGYVEVADKENVQSTNITQQLSTIIGRIVSVNKNTANTQEEILARIVRLIIGKIINQARRKRKSVKNDDVDKILGSLSPEVFNTIKRLIIETDKDNPRRNTFKKLKARFIPLSLMEFNLS